MSEHAPKVAALEAYRGDLLTPQGERRVERHLESCEPCRRTLASMQAYDELAEQVRRSETPAVDWSKMELALAREARTQARDGRRTLALGLLAAAAVLAAVAAWPREQPQTPRHAEAPALPDEVAQTDPPPATAPAEAREGEVTAVVGDAQTRGEDGAARALDVGATLAEGARVETAEGAEVHVRLGAGTGLVAHGETALSLATLTEDAVQVTLDEGTVSNEVAPLADDARYDVRAGRWAVRVKGTRFAVSHGEDWLEVDVTEGTVEVVEDGEVRLVLEGPSRWTSGRKPVQVETVRPRGLEADAGDWPILRLPSHDEVARWQIEPPVDYAADDRLAMRVPAGKLGIRARGRNGQWHELTVHAEQGEVTLAETQLDTLAKALGGPAQGTLAPEKIRPVVRQARPALKRCHERLMKERPDLGGRAYRLQLRVTVGRSGVVQRTALETASDGDPPPAALQRCIHSEMKRRPFPEPTGGPVTFEVPLRFQPTAVP